MFWGISGWLQQDPWGRCRDCRRRMRRLQIGEKRMSRKRGGGFWFTALVMVVMGAGHLMAGDPATDAQNKLLAKRAAEADCYRKLAECVYGVQLTSDTYVRDFITESDQIRAGVDTFVRGIRLGTPRYFEDGVCEVDGDVTVAKLITTLKEVHEAHYK